MGGFFLCCPLPILCQSNRGELRLKVTDPSGLGLKAHVQIVSEGIQYRNTLATTDQGSLDVQRLPFGIYQLEISEYATSSRRAKFNECRGRDRLRRPVLW